MRWVEKTIQRAVNKELERFGRNMQMEWEKIIKYFYCTAGWAGPGSPAPRGCCRPEAESGVTWRIGSEGHRRGSTARLRRAGTGSHPI